VKRYRNLDLEAFDYNKAPDGTEHFWVRVEDSPAGAQKRTQAQEVALPSDLRRRVRRLTLRQLTGPGLRELGRDLAALAFPPSVRPLLERSWERIAEDEGLRVRLKLESLALGDLPWEYAYLAYPQGFLGLNRRISLVRYEVMEQARRCTLEPVDGSDLRVVLLSANPQGEEYLPLQLTQEMERVEHALGEIRDVQTLSHPDATLARLEEALLQGAHVFHFAGHGRFEGDLGLAFASQAGSGSIVLLGPDRGPDPFSAKKLAVKLADRGVRLAVLAACESGRQDQVNPWTGVAPALVRAGIPVVIGMQYTIRDENAIAFSCGFYAGLVAGLSIDAALAEGRQAIFTRGSDGERDWGVPVLYACLGEGEAVLFPGRAAGSRRGSAIDRMDQTPAGEEAYDLATVRALLNAAFGDQELQDFCADHFRDVYNQFTAGQTKSARVRMLMDHAVRHLRLTELLELVREAAPEQYARFEEKLVKRR
jgi:hypothetical protein